MKEIKLYLVPQPGSKPEFLATVQVVDPSPVVSKLWEDLPEQVVLEGYTRDGWAWKPSPAWQTLVCRSVDGRKKLPGFCNYLKQRTKSAFGRFGSSGVWVVSYVQTKQSDPDRMQCKIAMDFTKVSGCTLQPKQRQEVKKKVPPVQVPVVASSSSKRSKGGGGLLGKLVGAQQRTNQHVAVATAPSVPSAAARPPSVSNGGATSTAPAVAAAPTIELKTAQQVFSDFRQAMEQKMLDFDISSEEQLKVTVSLTEQTANLEPSDKSKVTMDVLKYMVYEAAEEVNEEWIAYKEPSEFMDEAVIAVYKEGAAPPEVLEEINKGELPDEVRGQQRAMQEERQRQVSAKEQKTKLALESQALQAQAEDEDEEELEALNINKRDRRTIEDYEREKREAAKKRRV